ncbi:MAG: alpha/beta hydrolase domain-containing protein [Candidatus Binatia bacterium]
MMKTRSWHLRRRQLASAASLVVAALLAVAGDALADVPNPVVEGPIGGGLRGRPWQSSLVDVEPFGYTEEEYFFQGVARTLGQGSVGSALQMAPYESRMIVRRPVDPAGFNGTVLVEWLNVTGQTDLEVLWGPGSSVERFTGDGYAFVGVSAQLAGICCGPLSLKMWDPVRYAPLAHPGDDFSFDIFSQAIEALRNPRDNRTTILDPNVVDPMGGLEVERVIVHGASQSAGRLTTYLHAGFHEEARLIDGFLITRGGNVDAAIAAALETPVFQVNEENIARDQPDNAYYRLWQEAGAAHAPLVWWSYVWAAQSRDAAGMPLPDVVNVACSVNRATSDYSFAAAVFHLNEWIRNGTPPPTAPRINRDGAGNIVRDEHGLATGGVRHPFVAVPIATNDSTGCPLWGNYKPWTRAKILEEYPTKSDYVSQVEAQVDAQVAAGFMLAEDGAAEKARAAAFDVWTEGTCYDTANPSGNASGPLSQPLDDLAFSLMPTVGFGVGQAVHDVNCNGVVRAGQ